MNVGVLVSGGGTNLQAIIDAVESGEIPARISVVISNVEGAYALERAKKHGIPGLCIPHKGKAREEHEKEIIDALERHKAELVVLAGYLRMLTPQIIRHYPNRILNIHPALLPSFGGPGMHGLNVHKAVIDYGCKVSGCTVHLVDEGIDTGPIIVQRCVPVMEDDTPETLAKRVLSEEHKAYVTAVKLFAENQITVSGRRVIIGKND